LQFNLIVKSLVDEWERPIICESAQFHEQQGRPLVIKKRTIRPVPRSSILTFLGVGIWQYDDAISSVDTFSVNFVNAP
jgi:hypothetical protein